MTTELKVVDPTGLSEAEQAELDKNIDALISAHKSNRQEINRLVFQSVSAMTESEDYERQLANKKGLRRFLGSITGSNKKLQDKINSNRAIAQYASQQTLQRIAEQNLMSFDLITAVNNKLNASVLAVEGEINQVYKLLASFFKQNRSDLIKMENRLDRLEQNVNLLNWQNSIEYQMFDGVEYADLDDTAKLVCIARDFYDITKGEWTTSDLLLLKSAMATIGLPPREKINYLSFICQVAEQPELKVHLLGHQNIKALPEPDYLTILSGIKKMELLETEESFVVQSVSALLAQNSVNNNAVEIENTLAEQFLQQSAGINSRTEVECFDFILELLFNLRQAENERLLQAVQNSNEQDLEEQFDCAAELFKNCKLKEAEPLLVYLSDSGFARANALLYWLYQDQFPADDDKSNAAATKGYDAGDTICSLQYALSCSQDDDEKTQIYEKFIPLLRAECDSGDLFATYMLAICSINDIGKPHDYSLALSLFLDACTQGFYRAFWGMALRYMYGQGVDKNTDSALLWANKALSFPQYIEPINTTANYLYDEGRYDEALSLYLKYEAMGGTPYNRIGNMYSEGKGTEPDYVKAYDYFFKGMELFDTNCMYNMGRLCIAIQDYDKAIKCFSLGAQLEDSNCYDGLGDLYYHGNGVDQDYKKAKECYEKGAELSCSLSCFSLGLMYGNGIGVEQDYVHAKRYYEKGAELGHSGCYNNLAVLYENGSGVTRDYSKAAEYYKRSAGLGDEVGQRNLGRCYLNSIGVSYDRNEAKRWLEASAAQGDERAKDMLRQNF